MLNNYSSSASCLVLLVIIGFSGCANGTYSVTQFQRSDTEVILTGKAFDSRSGIALPGVLIRNAIDSSGTYTNKDGSYKMKLFTRCARLKAVYIGYYHNITKRLELNPGDSVVVNFRMREDTRPLID